MGNHPLATRRAVTIAGLALTTWPACAAPEQAPRARADLYTGQGMANAIQRDPADLSSHAVLAPPGEPGEPFRMSGRVLSWRSRQPTPNVVVYMYHTDATGVYGDGGPMKPRLQGWMKTDREGRYSFASIKPAPYPDLSGPAHIHPVIAEPNRPPYWLDQLVFEGEFKVDDAWRASHRGGRGYGTTGDGVMKLSHVNAVWTVEHDIILERHPDQT